MNICLNANDEHQLAIIPRFIIYIIIFKKTAVSNPHESKSKASSPLIRKKILVES